MSLSSYSDLKSAVASFEHRSDTGFTAAVDDFIDLAEADMQARCKLLEFETTATVTITAGSGTLPTGYVGMRSAYWDGDTSSSLEYISPDRFDYLRNTSGTPAYYTVTGSTIRTSPEGDGSLVMTYLAKFTPLSDSNTSNSILADHPDAYLYGALYHSALWRQDDPAAQKYQGLFSSAISRINQNNSDRKWAGPLMVRAR